MPVKPIISAIINLPNRSHRRQVNLNPPLFISSSVLFLEGGEGPVNSKSLREDSIEMDRKKDAEHKFFVSPNQRPR